MKLSIWLRKKAWTKKELIKSRKRSRWLLLELKRKRWWNMNRRTKSSRTLTIRKKIVLLIGPRKYLMNSWMMLKIWTRWWCILNVWQWETNSWKRRNIFKRYIRWKRRGKIWWVKLRGWNRSGSMMN